MSSFNLVTEPWIPCVDLQGRVHDVSIQEALVSAPHLGEIQCDSPLATVATIRLLLAILHAACGPEDSEEWAELWEAKCFPEAKIIGYLEKWKPRFDLFDEDLPFLQVGKLTMKEAGPLAQFATELATGNNPTLFNHTCDDEPVRRTPAQAARMLLATQAFALGFGKAAEAVVDGKPFPRPYLADAPCLRGVNLWLSAENLFQTLTLNLVSRKANAKDIPLWEYPNPFVLLDTLVDNKRASQKAFGIVDRYVWLSRMARLVLEEDGTVRNAYFTQGREADKSKGDPMKVFVASRTEGVYALGLNADKAAWRDLHSYLTFDPELRSPILGHVAEQVEDGPLAALNAYRLNVVGLATDPGKAGKFLLWRHDRMSITGAVLARQDLIGQLSLAVNDADFVARDLGRRARQVVSRYLPPDGNPDPKDVDKLCNALDTRQAYWARLEGHFPGFLKKLPQDATKALEEWRHRVELEASRALREACDSLGNSTRAIKAVAQVSYRFLANEAEVNQLRAAAKAKTKGGKKL
jgi:CRISPR system Cascade subunit CasA